MNTQPNMEERLWSFIDGTVSPAEKDSIGQLLASDAAWRAKYKELLEVNELLRNAELDAPSLRFTKNVMEEISRLHIAPATKTYINKKIVWALGFFFIAMLLGFIIYGISQVGFSGGEESTITRNINKVDFSKFFNNTWMNALMMINIVIGLLLFDNYLTIKKKEFRKTS